MRAFFAMAVITATILAPGFVLAAGAMRLPPPHVIAAIGVVIPHSLPDVSAQTVRRGMWWPSTIRLANAKVPWPGRFLIAGRLSWRPLSIRILLRDRRFCKEPSKSSKHGAMRAFNAEYGPPGVSHPRPSFLPCASLSAAQRVGRLRGRSELCATIANWSLMTDEHQLPRCEG